MRLGIMGGTFDPPHLGHNILANECMWQLRLDRVLWVLTANSPLKLGQQISPVEIRIELVRAAIAEEARFELSRVDIDRPAPQYAVDTLRLLHDQFPEAELVYLMGGDSLNDLPKWHTPIEFLRQADSIGVMARSGEIHDMTDLEANIPGIVNKVDFITAPLIEISATEIRRRAAEGTPYAHFLLPKVAALLIDPAFPKLYNLFK